MPRLSTSDRWARAFGWLTPIVTFILGIVAASSASFVADWLTDLRRGEHLELSEPVCAASAVIPLPDRAFLDIRVRRAKGDCWQRSINGLRQGDTFEVILSMENNTRETIYDVMVLATLSDHTTLVPGSSLIANPTHPQGVSTEDRVITGINIGDYPSGSNAFLKFRVQIAYDFVPQCGLALNATAVEYLGFRSGDPEAAWYPPTDIPPVFAGFVTNRPCD